MASASAVFNSSSSRAIPTAAASTGGVDVGSPTAIGVPPNPLTSDVVTQVKALNQQAVQLMRKGDLDRAEELLAKAQAATTGPGVARDDPAVIAAKVTTINNQGCMARRRGANLKAVSCFETAMSLERHIHGTVAATTLINLSTALTAMGEAERAAVVAADALAAIPKEDVPLRAIAMHNLAVAKHCAGDRAHAVSLLQKALKVASVGLGDGHSTTQSIRARLAEWQASPGASAAGRGAHPGGGAMAALVPAPPLTGRQAAARALRSLDFGTPDPADSTSHKGSRLGTAGADSTMHPGLGSLDTPLPSVPDAALPSRDAVMAGATFAAQTPPAAGDKTLPAIPQASPSTAIPTPQPHHFHHGAGEPGSSSPSSIVLPPIAQQQQLGATSLSARGVRTSVEPGGTDASSTTTSRTARKAAHSRPEPHGFCRFAVDEIARQPPPRIGFADVRNELRSKTRTTGDMDGDVMLKSSQDGGPIGNPFHSRAVATSRRKELELAEDRAFVQRRLKQQEIEQREQERQHRAKLVALSRRTHAARIIQTAYRRWRATNKAMLDAKRQQEQKEGVNRAKTVVNFANKWLNRTAGKRLVARMNNQSNFQLIDEAVRTIQRAWKSSVARDARAQRRKLRDRLVVALAAPERKGYAAVRIQCWFRQLRAKWKLRSLRVGKYVEHCIAIQRWIRSVFHRRRHVMSEKIMARRREYAATKLQAVWRGIAARFFTSMLRFQRRVAGLRNHEVRAVVVMQRILRGFGGRRLVRRVKDARIAKRKAELEYRPTEAVETVALRVAAPSRNPPPARGGGVIVPMTVERSLVEHEKRRQLELELAIESQRQQVQAQFNPGLSRRDVETMRAAEMLTRSEELQQMKRLRAAITLQRTLRRYFKSQTFGERQRFAARRSVTAAAEVERNSTQAKESFERARRREANDLACDVRELKTAYLKDMATVQRESAVLEQAAAARSVEERTAAAAELKRLEDELAAQLAREKEAMRQYEVHQRPSVNRAAQQRQSLEEERAASEIQYGVGSGSSAYLTLRQRRALLQSSSAAAGSP